MAVKSGLVLKGYHPVEVVCRPLSAELARCYWVINDQAGPFDFLWTYETPENEAFIDSQFLEVPACENTSTTCWRPGTLPNLASRVVVDEWTYFFAIDAPEQEVCSRAGRIDEHIGDLSCEFLERLDGLADLFMLHVDGWWELYTVRSDWHDRLLSGLPGSPRGRGNKRENRQPEVHTRSRCWFKQLDEGIPVLFCGVSHEPLSNSDSDECPQNQIPFLGSLGCLSEEPFFVEPSPFPGDGQQVGKDDRSDLEQIDVPQLLDAVTRLLHDPGDPLEFIFFKLRVEPQLRECRPDRLSSFDLCFIVNHDCDHDPDVAVSPILGSPSLAPPEPSE